MRNKFCSRGVVIGSLLLAALPASAQTVRKTTPGQIDRQRDDILYGIVRDETLSSIALRFTGNTANWPAIGKANGIVNDRTIAVGSAIVIPARLLPDKNAFATIVASQGSVSIVSKDGDVIDNTPGARLSEGALIATAGDGFITLRLKDGTTFALTPGSSLQLSLLQIQQFTDRPRTGLLLQKGRVTSLVTPFTEQKSQYEVRTPLAVAGVRGTRFRVNLDDAHSYSEVLEGTVRVAPQNHGKSVGNAGASTRNVKAGYGAIASAGGKVSAPRLLPAAPALSDATQLQEHLPVRFTVSQPEAAAFRVSVSSDEDGLQRVADARVEGDHGAAQARFAELADGDYYVRAAAISGEGLEGKESAGRFRLKARPFAPFQQEPGAKLRTIVNGEPAAVSFTWTDAGQDYRYHLQVASDAGFTQMLADRTDLTDTRFTQEGMREGRFFWRVATIDMRSGNPDQGPWSDVKQAQLLPAQSTPAVDVGEDRMNFSWRGEAGQTFVFEVAAATSFDPVLLRAETAETHAGFALPPPGVYYAHLRSTDADGYRGPWSAPQRVTIERRWMTGAGLPLSASGAPVRGD